MKLRRVAESSAAIPEKRRRKNPSIVMMVLVVLATLLAARPADAQAVVELAAPAPGKELPSRADENAEAKRKAAEQGNDAPPALDGAAPAGPQPEKPQGSLELPPGEEVRAKLGPAEPGLDKKLRKTEPDGEIKAKRTETSKTYDNGDGSFRTQAGSRPLHVRMPDGTWEDIDNTLESDGKGKLKPKRGKQKVEIAENADDATAATVDIDADTSVSYRLVNKQKAKGTKKSRASSATHEGVLPETDIEYEVISGGLKETIVLASKHAPSEFVFAMDLKNLEATLVANGNVELRNPKGELKAVIPAPTVEDASTVDGMTMRPIKDPVRYELRGQKKKQELVVKIDRAWLDDAKRVFPVKIDPTTWSAGAATADTWYDECTAGNANWVSPVLEIGDTCDAKAVVKWDVTGFGQQGVRVIGAEIGLWNGLSRSCNVGTEVFHIYQPWDVDTIGKGFEGHGNLLSENPYSYGAWDNACGQGANVAFSGNPLRDVVQDWAHNPGNNHGVLFRVPANQRGLETTRKNFNSSDASWGAERNFFGPRLDVTWTPFQLLFDNNKATMVRDPWANRTGILTMPALNLGRFTWNAQPNADGVYKTAAWVFPCGVDSPLWIEPITRDLPHDIAPGGGGTLTFEIPKLAPQSMTEPGCYSILFDIFHYDREGKRTSFVRDDFAGTPSSYITIKVYNQPAVSRSVAPVGQTDTVTPTLSFAVVNPDEWPAEPLYYAFRICRNEAMTEACQESGKIEHRNFTNSTWKPPQPLLWETQYYWQAITAEGQSVWPLVQGPLPLMANVPQTKPLKYGADPHSSDHEGVNMSIGNFTRTVTDISVDGVGAKLRVDRTYNSLDGADHWFGKGWTGPWDITATREPATSTVLVTFTDGHQQRFGENFDGTFSPSGGRPERLTGNATSGYTLILGNGAQNVFDPSGRLSAIVDGQGHQAKLFYNATTGRLERVVNMIATGTANPPTLVEGRKLTITWTATTPARIASISTDPVTDTVTGVTEPITVSYKYTGDKLTQVCGPVAATTCSTYHYGTAGGANGRLTQIVMPKNTDYIEVGYRPDGTVAWRENALNNRTTFDDNRASVAGLYHPLPGQRIFDSSTNGGNLAYNTARGINVVNTGGVPAAGVESVAVNITVVGAPSDGTVRAYPSGQSAPLASSLQVKAGRTVDQLHLLAVGPDGKVNIEVMSGATTGTVRVLVDVLGWFGKANVAGGHSYHPIDTTRVMNTHPWGDNTGVVAANTARKVQVTGKGTEPNNIPAGATAAIVNLTAFQPAGAGWMAAYPSGTTRPDISNAQYNGGDARTNQAVVKLDATGAFDVYVAGSSTHVLVDVLGWFGDALTSTDGAVFKPNNGTRVIDTRPSSKVGANEKWQAGGDQTVALGGTTSLASKDFAAFAGTITTVAPVQSTWVAAWPGGTPFKGIHAHFGPGQQITASSLMGHKLSRDGSLTVKAADAATDLIIDSFGAFNYFELEVVVTAPKGNKATFTYDSQRRLVKTVDEPGKPARTLTYAPNGALEKMVDPTGRITEMKYDDRGQAIATTTQDSGEAPKRTDFKEYYFNAADPRDPRNGKVTAIRDPRSTPEAGEKSSKDDRYRTTMEYNPDGTLKLTRTPATPDFPAGRTVENTYATGTEPAVGGGTTPRGLPLTTKDRGGDITRFAYDAKGNLAVQTAPSGLVTEVGVDQLGRVTRVTEKSDSYPSGVTTKKGYDKYGREVYQEGPPTLNPVTNRTHILVQKKTYDANGNLATEEASDKNGWDPVRKTTYTHDAANRIATVTNAAGALTTKEYDADGNLTKMCEGGTTADPCGGLARATALEYTPRGQHAKTTLVGYIVDPINAPTTRSDLLVESRSYDAGGRLASAIDARGKETVYTYVDGDLPKRVTFKGFTNPDGTKRDIVMAEFDYDAARNKIWEKRANGTRHINYLVDAANRTVISATDPTGRNRVIATNYNADDQPLKVTTTEAGRSETRDYGYNAAGMPTSMSVPFEGGTITTSTVYDQRGLQKEVKRPGGSISNYTYDEAGRLLRESMPLVSYEVFLAGGGTVRPETVHGYNAFGDQVAVKDARGNVTQASYDTSGRQVSTTYPTYTTPLGNPMTPKDTQQYDVLGNVIASTDRRGNITRFDYDQRGNVVRQTDPASVSGRPAGVTTMAYDAAGNMTTRTSATGAQTVVFYDDLTRASSTWTKERFPAPGAAETWYAASKLHNDAGDVTLEADESGVATTYVYDGLGAVTAKKDGGGFTSSFTYDVAGRPVTSTDPEGRKVVNAYDLAGRRTQTQLQSSANAVLRTEKFGYDLEGNQTSYTDAANTVMTAEYDPLGRVTKQTQPIIAGQNIVRTFAYDQVGNQTRATDGNGRHTWRVYNPWNLEQSVVESATTAHPNLGDYSWTTTYDAAGTPVTTQAPGGVVRSRVIDALGRPTSETGTGAEAATTTRTFDYDLDSRMTSVSKPGGTIGISYNDRGSVTNVADDTTTTYAYDQAGRVTNRSDAAGTSAFTYDNRGLLKSATDPLTGSTGTYTYSNAGQLSKLDYGSGRVSYNYGYHPDGRLKTESLKNGATVLSQNDYEYDLKGNVTAKTVSPTAASGAGRNTYAYDLANRMTKWTNPASAATDYTYDNNGNRTKAGARTFTYDERNRMLTAVNGATTTKYTWSARGTLASRQVGTAAAVNTKFDAFDRTVNDGTSTYTYDGFDRVRTTGTKTFKWSGLSKELADDGTSQYSHDANMRPVATKTGTTASILVANAHGDMTGTVAATGTALASSRSFDPWGKVLGTAGTGSQPGRAFQGDYTDPGTGRVDMNARLYDPDMATFTARDSVTDPAMGNRYGYTSGNPVGYTDPTGHLGFSIGPFNVEVPNPVQVFKERVVEPVYRHVVQPIVRKAVEIKDTVVNFAVNTFNAVKSFVGNAINTVKGWVSSAKNWAANAWKATKNFVGRVVNKIGSTAYNAYQQGKAAATAAYNKAKAVAQQAVTVAKTKAAGVVNIAKYAAAAVTPALANYANGLRVRLEETVRAAQQLAPVILSATKEAFGNAVQVVTTAVGSAASAVGDFARSDWGAFGAALEIVGMIPVIGEVADGILCAKSLMSGQFADAAFDCAAMIPIAGNGAKAAKWGKKAVDGMRALDKADDARDTAKAVNAASDASRKGGDDVACAINSFEGSTLVLMADGSRKAIREVKAGDEVWAADPESGEFGARTVEATITGEGAKRLVDVTVKTAGGVATIVATDGHPFWVDDTGAWVDADDLEFGDDLLTADGERVDVIGTRVYTTTKRVHNLTVEGIHTYYVTAGTEDLLVHNCGSAAPKDFNRTESLSGRPSKRTVDNLASTMKENGGFGDIPPIDVVKHGGSMYVTDGHHRLAAAKKAGLSEIPYRTVDADDVRPGGVAEIIQDWAAVRPDRIR